MLFVRTELAKHIPLFKINSMYQFIVCHFHSIPLKHLTQNKHVNRERCQTYNRSKDMTYKQNTFDLIPIFAVHEAISDLN